ncbi:Geranylgeranyl pyrophosphate synthase, partial [Diplodia seriata]
DTGEELSIAEAQAEHDDLYAALDPDDRRSLAMDSKAMKTKRLVSQCMLECVGLDRELGLNMLAAFRDLWLVIGEKDSDKEPQTMEEYLRMRSDNGGMLVFWPMLQFSLGMHMSGAEHELVQPIIDAATQGLLLANDYFSWERECIELETGKSKRIVSAVELLIRTKGLSVPAAKDAVKAMIIRAEGDFCLRRDKLYREQPDVSLKLKRWIDCAGLAVSGNHYWCSACPRQNAWKNEQPTDMFSSPASGTKRHLDHDSTSSTEQPSTAKKTKRRDSGANLPDTPQSESSAGEPRLTQVPWYPLYKPSSLVMEAPAKYITSMPSKGVRSVLIEALNTWLHVPPAALSTITSIVDMLHNASLILDDLEDNSPLRRGLPAAHTIFGQAQSINSANFLFVRAMQEVARKLSPAALAVVLEELEGLYLGQSWDLYWKHSLVCPSEAEYINMVDHKTGGMFRMLLRLMEAESRLPPAARSALPDFQRLTLLFGRFFQIRDDYMNFGDYAAQKGFCEDLDEGKFSFPVVHCLEHHAEYRSHILGVFRQRPTAATSSASPLSRESKQHLIGCLEKAGSFEKTLDCLREVEMELEAEIEKVEQLTQERNPMLRLCVVRLSAKGFVPVGAK